MTRTLSNIDIKDFRDFLTYMGCKCVSTNGGHEKWKRGGDYRPVVFQTHKKRLPVIVVLSNFKTLGLTRTDYELWLSVGKPKK